MSKPYTYPLRVPAELAQELAAAKPEGESINSQYCRLLEAGLRAEAGPDVPEALRLTRRLLGALGAEEDHDGE